MNRGTLNSLYTPVGALSAGGLVTGVAAGIGCIYVNARLTKELAIQNTEIMQLRSDLSKATAQVEGLRQMVAKTVKEVRKTASEMKTLTDSSSYSTRGSRRSSTQEASSRHESERRKAPVARRNAQVSEAASDVSEIDEFFD